MASLPSHKNRAFLLYQHQFSSYYTNPVPSSDSLSHPAGSVLAITNDKASNNSTLVSSIQESVQSLVLDNDITIIRIPCFAHLIQLNLKQLLGQIKANPKNETTEIE